MMIVVNGQRRDIAAGYTGSELLEELDLSAERLAVERNGDVMDRQAFAACTLCDGDIVEIVRFVGGG